VCSEYNLPQAPCTLQIFAFLGAALALLTQDPLYLSPPMVLQNDYAKHLFFLAIKIQRGIDAYLIDYVLSASPMDPSFQQMEFIEVQLGPPHHLRDVSGDKKSNIKEQFKRWLDNYALGDWTLYQNA